MLSSLKRQFLSRSAFATLVVMLTSMLIVDISYRSELKQSTYDQLRLHIYTLLSFAQHNSQGLQLGNVLSNPRFNRIGSGLWAVVLDGKQNRVWESLSLDNTKVNLPLEQAMGSWLSLEYDINGKAYLILSYKIAWETETSKQQYYFVAAEDERLFRAEVSSFRWWLGAAFSFVTLCLLVIQNLVLSRSFRPINALANEITAMENGTQNYIEKKYPAELEGVTRNLNALIKQEHKQREKYRESMADLAHSLKTPLSVIRGELRTYPDNISLQNALERIDQSVEYQLRRAVISGHTLLTKGSKVLDALTDLLDALKKVYVEQARLVTVDVADDVFFLGDENDLLEILGNLLDNAYKYSISAIHITAKQYQNNFSLCIEDDGEGLKGPDANNIWQRGTRLDRQGLGQGIGLAVVKSIVNSYEGNINVSGSSLGGAKFLLTFTFRDK